jgi:hypothetical protein
MSFQTVDVTVAADTSGSSFAEGNVVAIPAGTMWPDTNNVPIVPMVVHGTLANGTCTITLVASDNFTAGVLAWDLIINIRGMPTVNVPGCVVNHADGATQSVWGILTAAGWTPLERP